MQNKNVSFFESNKFDDTKMYANLTRFRNTSFCEEQTGTIYLKILAETIYVQILCTIHIYACI